MTESRPNPRPQTEAGKRLMWELDAGEREHYARAILAIEAEARSSHSDVPADLSDEVERLDYDAMRVAREWPTLEHMRRAADALDIFTPARYGDVLRWFADRCDEWVWHMGDPAAKERIEQARAALAAPSAGAGTVNGHCFCDCESCRDCLRVLP